MPVIYEFRDVSYTAPPRERGEQPVRILSASSFKIGEGTNVVITGPSGSGKSTLLRLFNRLADPTSGEILYRGNNIAEYPVQELRRKIGWVPQVPVRFSGSVEDNIRLSFKLSREFRIEDSDIESRMHELKEMGLLTDGIFKRKAIDISVGEAQRMNLLRAIALTPEVLLMDEPTSALDPDAADILLSQVEKICSQENLTAIMVSHRPEEVMRFGDLVLKVNCGEVREEGAAGG